MQLQSSDLRSLCIDDVLLQPVDIVITRILRPHWHKVPVKAKQLVGELCTLRTLIKSLLKNDCVRWRRLRFCCCCLREVDVARQQRADANTRSDSTKLLLCAATWPPAKRNK